MFLNNWATPDYSQKQGLEAMQRDFQIDDAALKGVRVLLASYGYQSDSGDAFVLFRRGGKLWEVNGSHCSCYGLEGQWDPSEVTKEELTHRLDQGNLGRGEYDGNKFDTELRAVLKKVRAPRKTLG